MSGLLTDLVSASQSLTAQQAGVEVAGRNLANINNPDYSRETVELGDRITYQSGTAAVGNGVEVLSVQQVRDQFLDAAVTREGSQTGLLQAVQSGLSQAQTALGEQIDSSSASADIGTASSATSGLSASLNDFFNAFNDLAATPQDTGTKQVLLEKAGTLADTVNVTDQRLSNLQSDITQQVQVGTDQVNSLLSNIANLNGQIQKYEIGNPDSALALRDQRQADLEKLSNYIDFTATSIPGSNGQIQVTTKDTSGNDVTLVKKVTATPLSFNGTQISAGTPPVVLGLQGGSLQGSLQVRDGAIQQLRDNIKQTADQIASGVNAAYGVTGSNFFQVPPSSGLLSVDPSLTASNLKASATSDAGANEVALAVANVGTTTYSTSSGGSINGTITGYYSQVVSGLGASLDNTNTQLNDQQLIQQMTTTSRDAVSGVSMDEEMSNMMKFQRSYEASARVVGVIDEMLNTLVNTMLPTS